MNVPHLTIVKPSKEDCQRAFDERVAELAAIVAAHKLKKEAVGFQRKQITVGN